MGKLIKNHLARLIVMTAATYHIAASLHGFFWPKFFFDFLTKNFDPAVKPVPILQTINLIFGFINLAWEWPLEFLAGTAIHRSLELRILLLPLSSLTAVLLYQGTNPAMYYLIGCGMYFWAYTDGEVVCAKPWTLPRRPSYPKQIEET
ncbi:hypothetical protein E4T50_16724 [Aureobasidium sp. EXF-12298]|nr:hypothetical protein E4T50_16724 [Aureobasidium sp. EXF-12298]KAI4750524.1 hypothetical protein E4T51_16168 [Aureobasidium sp. EXF-12344]KAI4767969.1 hypothetical protein E4T52_16919 [Aureobasidium sp. EXF-3400]